MGESARYDRNRSGLRWPIWHRLDVWPGAKIALPPLRAYALSFQVAVSSGRRYKVCHLARGPLEHGSTCDQCTRKLAVMDRDPLDTARVTPTGAAGGTRQCIAVCADGHRCKKNPCNGSTVCEIHGGATPLDKTAAKKRLLSLIEPALDALEKALACGEWPTVVRAATVLLDRAGFGPHANIRVESDTIDLSELSDEQLVQRASVVFQRVKERYHAAQRQEDGGEQPQQPSVH